MPRQAIDLMFSAYRRRLLATLLLRPGEHFHVHELKAVAETGLLLRGRAGNQVLYQANPHCPLFEELAAIFRKTSGLADLLAEALPGWLIASTTHWSSARWPALRRPRAVILMFWCWAMLR